MLQSTDYASQDKQMETFRTSLMFHEKFFLIKCSTESPICIVWECLGEQGDQTSRAQRNSALNIHWCWSWTWCKQLTHCKSWFFPDAGKDCRQEEKGMRGWDGWMASLTQWTWFWVDFRSWWWTGRPGVLRFMGLQRVGYDWATELNWRYSLCEVTINMNLMNISKHLPWVLQKMLRWSIWILFSFE